MTTTAPSIDQSTTMTLPRGVAWLGYGGLLPFLILTPASIFDYHHAPLWREALFTYGAVILSFVGALHWGFAMTLTDLTDKQRSARFIWSVVPALLAWPAALLGSILACVLLVLGFVACLCLTAAGIFTVV